MNRLIIIVEGDTEKEFVNTILLPYFNSKKFYNIDCFKIKHSKGGLTKYEHVKKDIINTIFETGAIVTTLIDFYALPKDFPQFSESLRFSNKDEQLSFLENAIKEDIESTKGKTFDNLLPYIQLHEFEALVFSCISGIESLFDDNEADFIGIKKLITEFPNPEYINNGLETAPSKRLIKLIKGYNKIVDGVLILQEIGLPTIRKKCLRFNNWLNNLEQKLNIN
ncbi:DUF4276 family protein [Tenacibaculum sp. TC6]|uniref:DUF4276 family protein n=1 Tax=Tenacibaculum sp. TC6 TaxID=3423223 RepID=UPI003D3623AB